MGHVTVLLGKIKSSKKIEAASRKCRKCEWKVQVSEANLVIAIYLSGSLCIVNSFAVS